MRYLSIKVFDHTNTKNGVWADFFKRVNTIIAISGFQLSPTIIQTKSVSPFFYQTGKDGNNPINETWFTETFSKKSVGFDFVLAFFEKRKWKKPFPKNTVAGQSLNESFGVSEIAMYGSFKNRSQRPLAPNIKESEAVVRFIHELCHSMFDHKLIKPDTTHYWHYDKGNLLSAILEWKKKPLDSLYETALSHVGEDASPNDYAPDELACMESVDMIFHEALGRFIDPSRTKPEISTYRAYIFMEKSPLFKKVTKPSNGTIIISPSGYGDSSKVSNGHIGICSKDGFVYSNSSKDGIFTKNYTTKSWNAYWGIKGRYPVVFFDPV